jgi:hypothetical protein
MQIMPRMKHLLNLLEEIKQEQAQQKALLDAMKEAMASIYGEHTNPRPSYFESAEGYL